MSRTTVTFNGHDLTADYIVSNLRVPLLPRTLETVDVPGMDGALLSSVRLAQRTVTLTLSAMGTDLEQRQAAARSLAAILAVDEPKPLYIGIDSGIYYMAVPNSEDDPERYVNATSFEVAFECPDPVAYGELKTLTVPAGGSLTFTVGGTYPAKPTASLSVTPTASNRLWKLALEDGTYLAYTIPGTGTTARAIAADCAARTLKVDNVVKMLAADADWLVLAPGSHTLTNQGNATAGATTVTYRERWL